MKCNNGYKISSGAWTSSTNKEFSQTISDWMQVVTVSIVWLVVASNIVSPSSLSSIWLMIHQVQLFLLLLITGAFIPIDVIKVITGVNYLINPFRFIPFEKVILFSPLTDNFNFPLSNSMYEPLKIESDSTIYNTFSFFICLLIAGTIHLLVAILEKKFIRKWNPEGKWSKLIKATQTISTKLFNYLTFGYYIRLVIEVNQYLLVSSLYEIKMLNINSGLRIISLSFAGFILILCLVFIVITFLRVFDSYQINPLKHQVLGELFSNIKLKKSARLYKLSKYILN